MILNRKNKLKGTEKVFSFERIREKNPRKKNSCLPSLISSHRYLRLPGGNVRKLKYLSASLELRAGRHPKGFWGTDGGNQAVFHLLRVIYYLL